MIAKISQKRKSRTHATYIDSLGFLKSSLAHLADSIPDGGFKVINECVTKHVIKKAYPNCHLYSRPPDTEEETDSHYRSLRRERSLGYSWVKGKYNLSSKDMDDYRHWLPAAIPTHIPDPVKQQINEGFALWKNDIYMLYEKGIKGGITMVSKRCAEKEENTCLHYVDANNVYGWAMSHSLPTGNHCSLSDAEIQELLLIKTYE